MHAMFLNYIAKIDNVDDELDDVEQDADKRCPKICDTLLRGSVGETKRSIKYWHRILA